MSNGRSNIRWAPRVPKHKIRRLYKSAAAGLLDEELLDDVGITLLLRCRDILTIRDATRGRVRCPRCARQGEETIILRRSTDGDPRDVVLRCRKCGWHVTWGEYFLSYRRKQLSSGGATGAFETYIRDYEAARSPRDRMLAVDQLIHEFHFSLRHQPTRAAGVNLIQGRLTDVVQFLDELTYGDQIPKVMKQTREVWRERMAQIELRYQGETD